MSLSTFIYSDWATKKQKLRKWWHRNDWKKAHSPSLATRIKTEWYYLLHGDECVLVAGWLIKFYQTKEQYMNWGDDINVYLLEKLTGKRIVPAEMLLFRNVHRQYACIGSIIPKCINKKTIIWGSGCMDFAQNIKKGQRPQAIKAVRGPLTREYLLNHGIDCPEVYGDPALLLPKVYQPKTAEKIYKLSVIPHHRDWDEPGKIEEYIKQFYPDAHIINMTNYVNWTDVIDEIVQSEKILSSSLHGLIVSEAYGVPYIFTEFLYHHPKYDKYEDYNAFLGRKFVQPVRYDEVISSSELNSIFSTYKRQTIDIHPLLDACPFNIAISL